ncbi:MAG: tetratricopeptide repeat protein [Pseudomonadota bacterium]
MGNYTLTGTFKMVRSTGLFLFIALVAGCAQSPTNDGGKQEFEGIYFVENESVDAKVRDDFRTAVELLRDEHYEAAIDVLKEVVKASHNNSAPYINIAMAYSKIDKAELAEENFKKALEINPEHPVALNEYALFLRDDGRYSEARELYETAVKKYPEYMPVRRNYGILCDLYLNEPRCALEHYEVYSEANPKDEDVKIWITTLKQKL